MIDNFGRSALRCAVENELVNLAVIQIFVKPGCKIKENLMEQSVLELYLKHHAVGDQ